mmetsp:Transcript_19886/g.55407  ORF Transcript_19886/g.55407 Transcript_19886/m.55407 type:complete len:111 (-) Transcript_19886:170-502(-)
MTSAFAVSRGGEVKWNRFSFFVFDPRFQVTDTGWCELKTGNFYAMPMVNFADPSKFQVDWYNAMAYALAVDLLQTMILCGLVCIKLKMPLLQNWLVEKQGSIYRLRCQGR